MDYHSLLTAMMCPSLATAKPPPFASAVPGTPKNWCQRSQKSGSGAQPAALKVIKKINKIKKISSNIANIGRIKSRGLETR